MNILDLQKKYSAIPALDFDLLLAYTIKQPKEFVYTHPEYKLSIFQRLCLAYFVYLRKKGYSVATITKHKEFYSLDFFVNKHVLIPRPETELIVESVLNLKSEILNHKLLLIDVGTGSGCIPISILCHCEEEAQATDEAIPWDGTGNKDGSKNNEIASSLKAPRNDMQVFATDISRRALKIAKKNAKKHGVKINFLHGNLLEPLLHNSRFIIQDSSIIITANLPYLTESQFQNEPSIQREPKIALVAENSGLALYEDLLKQIASICHCEERNDEAIPLSGSTITGNSENNGIAAPRKRGARNDIFILLEIDPSQTQPISKLIKQNFPVANFEIKKDLAGLDRLVIIKT